MTTISNTRKTAAADISTEASRTTFADHLASNAPNAPLQATTAQKNAVWENISQDGKTVTEAGVEKFVRKILQQNAFSNVDVKGDALISESDWNAARARYGMQLTFNEFAAHVSKDKSGNYTGKATASDLYNALKMNIPATVGNGDGKLNRKEAEYQLFTAHKNPLEGRKQDFMTFDSNANGGKKDGALDAVELRRMVTEYHRDGSYDMETFKNFMGDYKFAGWLDRRDGPTFRHMEDYGGLVKTEFSDSAVREMPVDAAVTVDQMVTGLIKEFDAADGKIDGKITESGVKKASKW